jgi:hypothetical protein
LSLKITKILRKRFSSKRLTFHHRQKEAAGEEEEASSKFVVFSSHSQFYSHSIVWEEL